MQVLSTEPSLSLSEPINDIVIHRVQQQKHSLSVTLPAEYTELLGIHKSSLVAITLNNEKNAVILKRLEI
jgi:hypothetical protein